MTSNNNLLGIYRILFFIALFFTAPFGRISEYAGIETWKMCYSVAEDYWFTFSLDANMAYLLALIIKLSIIFCVVGFFVEYFYWILFFSISVLLMYWSQFCFTTHELTPIPISVLIWALLDKSSSFRIDQKFKRKIPTEDSISNTLIFYQRVHFCLVFFSAGFSKLITSGLSWINGESLQNILLMQNFFFENAWATNKFTILNNWVVQQPTLCAFLSASALAIELFAPLALFKKISWFVVTCLSILQIAIFVIVYINFISWLPLYILWLPHSVLFKLIQYLGNKNEIIK